MQGFPWATGSFFSINASVSARRRQHRAFVRNVRPARRPHGAPSLREILAEELPKQGVYFFFDDGERTKFSTAVPRLVRIGTHGVSVGSVATLRNRLRTHFGYPRGAGNHRASVFRLHVGRAMIERDSLARCTIPTGEKASRRQRNHRTRSSAGSQGFRIYRQSSRPFHSCSRHSGYRKHAGDHRAAIHLDVHGKSLRNRRKLSGLAGPIFRQAKHQRLGPMERSRRRQRI